MPRVSFVGPTYQSQSPFADAERCVNFYPEIIESGQGISASALYPTPGLSNFVTNLANGPMRGMWSLLGRLFVVIGPNLYEIFANGTNANRGNLANDGQPVSMAGSNQQLAVASAGILYVLNLGTNALTTINNQGLPPISQVAFSDGFFLALQKNSNTFFVSVLLDATTWPGGQNIPVSVFTDNVQAILSDHREVWVFGVKYSVVYFDSGSLQIFDVIPGSILEVGCAAPFSPAKMDNTVYWLGADERGFGIVYRARGYTPERISNHSVEFFLQGYATISDAIGWTYQDQGHSFYVMEFPTAGVTWVFDAATGMWHERAFWNSAAAIYQVWRARYHQYIFGKHIVGDPASPNLYSMSVSTFQDFGNAIRRYRRAPPIATEGEWIFHHRLRLLLEVGMGPQPPLLDGAGNPRGPQVNLRWSDDAGKTWSNEYARDAGRAGQYRQRVYWFRLGRARARTYEINCTDAVPWRILDAYLWATPGFEDSERVAFEGVPRMMHEFRKRT